MLLKSINKGKDVLESRVNKNFNDLYVRVGVSFLILSFVGLLLYFSFLPLIQLVIALVVVGLGSVGIWEYATLCRQKKLNVSASLMIFFSSLEIFSIYLSGVFDWAIDMPIGVLLLSIFTFFIIRFKEIEDAIATVAVQFFSICYIAVPLGLFLKILYPSLSAQFDIRDGRIWILYLISVTKITDVAAYFVGKLFGKIKLSPILSPKKTIEGAIAGLLAATGLSIGFSYFGFLFPDHMFKLPLIDAIFLGALIGVGGQFGDLSESLLKRDARVKDSNKVPGLGGVLDVFDSLLFTIPILFFYLYKF